jgi:hypothetical protein
MSMRSSGARAFALVAMIFMVSLCFAGASSPVRDASAAPYSIIGIQVSRPSFAGTSELVPITITADGGPAGDVGGNYTVTEIKIAGKNITGFDYQPKSPSNDNGFFRMNITTPGEGGQTVTFTVNVTSRSADYDAQTYETFDFELRIVQPIVISAKVYNTGDVEAKNVTANFFADGTLIHSVEFNVSAGLSTDLSYNWTSLNIKRGQHTILVTLDDPEEVVEFSNGNNELSLTIYVGEQGNPVGAILTVALILVGIVFVLTYLQKPAKRTKKF